ncbi:hypothetical protein Pelo_19312 [Pelomyxa schiedti]|nr:hypothetical protein Pelo_19312 [Pelomyxa schiedti]
MLALHCKITGVAMAILYDITDKASFHHIPEWLRSIDIFCPTPLPKILVGTKLDLATTSRQVDYSEAKVYAEANSLKFWETSSKDSINVEEAIMALLADIKVLKEAEEPTSSSTVSQNSSNNGSCC